MHLRIGRFLVMLIPVFISSLGYSSDSRHELFSMSLKELLDIPVTSSTLTELPLARAPSSISVFTKDQIAKLGVDYLHELMAFVPGFQAFRQDEAGNEYYPSVRGHRVSTASREILVLLDGRRLNREFDGAIAVPMISMGAVQRVEFLRGPVSALYGSNSFSGVVSITTNKSVNTAKVSVGENDLVRTSANISNKTDGITFFSAFEFEQDNGERFSLQSRQSLRRMNSSDPFRNISIRTGVEVAHWRFEAAHYHQESEEFYVLGELANNINQTQNQSSNLSAEYNFDATSLQHYHFSARIYRERYFAESSVPGLGKTTADQIARGIQLAFNADLSLNDQHNLQFGTEYRFVDIDQLDLTTQNLGSDIVYPDRNRRIYGAYLQHQWAINATVSLISGLRADHYSSFNSAFSPRLGLIGEVSNRHTLKLLYGSAFRAPTTNELDLQDTFNLNGLEGNATLKPEEIQTLEVVWLSHWDHVNSSVTVFESSIENSIVRDAFATPLTFTNDEGKNTTQGLEIELETHLYNHVNIRASYTAVKNKANDDFRQAAHLGSITANYQNKKWNVNVASAFTGNRQQPRSNNTRSISSYWSTNTKVIYQQSKSLMLYLQTKNLFNQRIISPSERSDFTQGVPNRGRELSIGLEWDFGR